MKIKLKKRTRMLILGTCIAFVVYQFARSWRGN